MTHTFLAGRHRAALRLTLAVLLAAVLVLALGPTPANALPKWIREFVSTTFGPIDMTMGPDGKLLLAYVDATTLGEHHGELRFAVRDGSDWTTTTVAAASYCPHLDGIPLSLAYNANANLAAISFYDHCEAMYRVAIGLNPVGDVWVWTLEEPPNWEQGDWSWASFGSDIAIDDQGKIYLATIDDFKVYYMWRTEDDGWKTTGTPLRRENEGMVQDVSLALGPDGKPYIAWDTEGINYAYPTILNNFLIEHVTSEVNTGLGLSLVIDNSGVPSIAFNSQNTLKYARRTNTDTWEVSIADPGVSCNASQFPSLALDAAGNPHISYHCRADTSHGSVRYAHWDGAAWQIEHASPYYLDNEWTALVLDEADVPHILYTHYDDLSYATRTEVPPEAYIDNRPPLNDALSTATFTFHSNDVAATFECRLDSAAVAACASPQSYSGLADGSHTFQVRARDAAGRVSPNPAEYTWAVDSFAPGTTLTGTPPNPSASKSAAFAFSSNETGATFECQLDLAAFAACASPQSYSNLTDGSHTFEVRAKDAAGNVDPSPASYTWTIDTVVPDTTIDAHPPNPSTSAGATFAFSSSEVGATFACKLDSADYGPCTSPKSYSGLADGSHTFVVRAGDAAGNFDASPASYTWTIDTAPETTITTKPSNPSNDPTPDFAFTSSDGGYADGILFHCQTDANGWFPCGGDSITYYNLFDGDHTFSVKAEDTLGNVDPSPATWSWTMDLTAPETTITAKPAAATKSTNATFQFTSEDGATFECQLDSGSFAACTSPKAYTGLSEASHTFQVRAKDAAGNVGSPASYTWIIDTTPPETTITAHPDALTNSATATFSFTGVGAASFECKLDSGGFVACTSPISYTGLYNGSHTFHVWAIDAAGNYDNSTASYTWTVDTNPPETTLTGKPAATTNSTTAEFTFNGVDAASYECKLDTAAFAACASPKSYTGLTAGSHTFQVRAKDAAGNVDPSPATYTWSIDTAAPDTTLTQKPPNPSNSSSATFTFSSETDATFECQLDSGSFAVCTSPKSYTGLTDGSHTFQVRAKDAAGNVDPSPAGYTWTIDTVAPETTLTGKPAATTNSTTAEFTFSGVDAASFECKLDAAAFAACTSPKSYTGLTAGSHTFQVRAKDAAGNVDPSPAGYTWTVDTTPPETTIDFTDVLPGSIHFTVHFTEPVIGFANDDVTLSGTAGATTAIVTNLHDRMEFDLDVSGMTGDGTIVIAIAAGVATDAAGNGNTAATLTWTIETPGPDTSLDSYPPNPSNSATATFTFSGAGAASFECSLDDAPFAECASPHQVTNLADGPHFFAVRAVDDQGKADTDYPIHFWIVDTTPPETTIDFTDVLPGSIHFTVHFTEPVNGFANDDVTLSGTAGATTAIVTNLHDRMEFDLDVSGMTGDGTIVIAIAAGVATDAAGNGNTAATLTWTIDTTGPAVTITGAPPDPSASAGAVFTFSSDDATATFACSLDSADFAACASPMSYSGLSDGRHTFSVWATDAAGNTGDPAGHTWTIATIPPTTLTVVKETDPAGGTGFPFTLDPNPISLVTKWGSEGSDDGQFYYPLDVAVDGAGNVYVIDAYNYRIQKFDSDGDYLLQWGGEGDGNGQFGDLDGPRGVAVDAAGNVYVADTDNHRIQKFDGDGNYLDQWGSRGSGNGQFIVPTSVAVDGAGHVYVADNSNNRIQKFDGDGNYLAQWGSAGSGDGQFGLPYGVAVDAAGNVYVSDSQNYRIQKFDGDGHYLAQWGSEGDGNGQFDTDSGPLGVAVDRAGNVYVVDTYNHRIQRFDGDGNYLDKWGQYGNGDGQFLFPYGVTVDGAGTVYVADSGNQRIQKFAVPRRALLDDGESYTFDGLLPGTHVVSEQVPVNWSLDDVTCDGGSPVENGNGVSVTLALGDAVTCTFSNTYAADTTPPHTTIDTAPATKTSDNDPSFTFSSNEPGSTFECRLDSGNWQACTSPKSYTNVADGEHTFRVRATDPAGNTDLTPASHTWTINTTPPALTIVKATDPAGGTDFPFALDLSSAPLVVQWGSEGSGNGQFAYPNAVSVDAAGNVYVADSDNSRIQKFDGDGNYLAQWGEYGSGNGQFDYPNGVAVDAAGNVYVTDSNNYRIQKFDGDGDYLAQWGEYGSDDGQFAYPNAIAVDAAGHVYVVDADNGRIQKFDSNGHYLAQWGEFGHGNGQFDYPNGVAVDGAGNVYVTDANLHRIQKFDGDGHYLAQWGQYGSGNGQFNSPRGLVVAADGNVYVADSLNYRIQKFDGNGGYLGQWGSEGSGAGQFAYPRGVAVNGAGHVYVADADNSRIQKFIFQESAVLDDGESQTFSPLTPGTVLVSELAPANWTLDDITCDGGNPVENGNSVEVTLALGNDVTCTFSNVLLDTTPPETTITSVIFDVYTVDTITIAFSSEAGATFQCALDGGAWSDCFSPITYNDLADGPHTFGVRATDATGNTDPSPATAAWTVDTPGPDTSLDSTPPDPSTSRAATFTFSSADATHFECALDGATFAACTSPHTVTALADGPHLFEVRAVNDKGKPDATPAGYGWLVDATPPAVTVEQATDQPDPAAAGPVHFTVQFTEPVTGFTDADVTLSGTAGATTAVVTNLHDHMEYDVAVSGMTGSGRVIATVAAGVASDAAGNANTTSTSADNSVTYSPPPQELIYITTTGANGTAHNPNGTTVAYTKGDILKWNGQVWSKWFSSTAKGLPANADIFAFDVADEAAGSVWLTFGNDQKRVPGLGRVTAHEIMFFDGQNFSRFFDGTDVGLKTTGERINGLEVLPGALSPIGSNCRYYLLISTVAGGGVPVGAGNVNFTGEDVLGFCMTSVGANTAGQWHLVFEGQSHGLQKNNTRGLSANEDATTLYFTAKTRFGSIPAGAIFAWNGSSFSGALWRATDHGVTREVDGIDVRELGITN